MYKLWSGLLCVSIFSANTLIADDIANKEGVRLFERCAACHGKMGEKQALGKSLVINQMTKEQIVTSIEGYKYGTYGGSMRALMKSQVAPLNKAQVEQIAVYVASLNTQYKLKSLPIQVKPQYEVPPVRKVEKYVPDSFEMKIKTKRYAKELTRVKALIKHESLTAEQAKKRGVKQVYLTNIIFQEDNKSVLEIKSTPYLSANVILKFKYKSDGGKELSMCGYNNLGKRAAHSVVIRDDSQVKKLPVLNSDTQNKTISSGNDKAIYDYFGDIDLIPSDKIRLIGPYVASNSASVPINIRSSIKAKRVTLFATEEDEKPKMIVEWVLYQQALVDFDIKIKLVDYTNYDGNLISVVVESEDGKFYIANITIDVALAGGDV